MTFRIDETDRYTNDLISEDWSDESDLSFNDHSQSTVPIQNNIDRSNFINYPNTKPTHLYRNEGFNRRNPVQLTPRQNIPDGKPVFEE
jgi:hypothetical protein